MCVPVSVHKPVCVDVMLVCVCVRVCVCVLREESCGTVLC